MNEPLVSIIAVSLNHERFIIETLDSIKNQTYRNFELFIIDNASIDNSLSIIEEWIGLNSNIDISLVKYDKKEGLCKILNEAIVRCKGEFIQLISCDDVLAKEKLKRQVELFGSLDAHFAVIFSEAHYINNKSEIYYSQYLQSSFGRLFKVPEDNIYEYLLRNGNYIPALTCLIRSSVYRDIGNYDENLKYEDYDMWLRIAKKYSFKFDPSPAAYYRIHESNHNYKIDYKIENFPIYVKHAAECPEIVSERLINVLMYLYRIRHRLTISYYYSYKNIFGPIKLFRICYLLKVPFFVFSKLSNYSNERIHRKIHN